MNSASTWQIAAAILLGLVVGVLATILFEKLSNQVRRWRKSGPALSSDLQLTLEEIPIMAVIFDRSLTPIGMNRLARKEPVKLESLRSHRWFSSYLREAMHSSTSLMRPSNEDDPFWVNVYPLEDGYVVALIADEHDKHDTETLRRDFIANASHELNTPVAAISLLVEAMQQASDDPERVDMFAASLDKEVRRLAALTRDIARLSQAQTGWDENDLQIVEIDRVASEVVQEHQTLAETAGVELSFAIVGAKDVPVGARSTHGNSEQGLTEFQVEGNSRSIAVALANLVENAIQHSRRGGRVGVGVEKQSDLISIVVSDQGEGIPEDQQDKVFKRFYRIDSARTRRSGGTGLGLSIARNTARALRGDVVLWSKPGVGSTFTLKLPAKTNIGRTGEDGAAS